MIEFISRKNNIKVVFDGSIKRVPQLKGLIVTDTALGGEKSESIRGVINLEVNIRHLSQSEYAEMEALFMSSSTIDIIDNDKGSHYINYGIQGDTLDLEELEDSKNKTYYYAGSLRLNRK
ncbi:MAG: hypothetical protein ACRCZ0_08305 [Cetobacterium sp.]